jgi:hypothetical protein
MVNLLSGLRRAGPRLARLLLLTAVASVLLASPMHVALACSCAGGDPRDQLAEADAAFVGQLIATEGATSSGGITSSGALITWTFQVDVSVKGELPDQVDVESASSGDSCGFEIPLGRQVGVLLSAEGGTWHGGLCTQMDPDVLLEAAGPLPAPTGIGPATFLVGGSFGEARLVALDVKGRVLGYGAGRGETIAVDVCPGSRMAVESVADDKEAFVAVRDLRTMTIRRSVPIPSDGEFDLYAVACLDEDGRRVLALDAWDGGPARLWLVDGDERRVVFEAHVREATLQDDRALLVLPDGALVTVGADGDRITLGRVPVGVSGVALSPDGSKAAGTDYGGNDPAQSPTEVVVIHLPDGPVLRAALDGWNDGGDVSWIDDERLAYLPGGGDDDQVRVYDSQMREIGRFGGWYTQDSTVVEGMAYGIGWGALMVAELPGGPAKVLERFDSPETFAFAHLSRGPEVIPEATAEEPPPGNEQAGSVHSEPPASIPPLPLLVLTVAAVAGAVLLFRRAA